MNWQEAVQEVRSAVARGCADSKYGEVEQDEVRALLTDDVEDRQLDEALRWLKDRGEIDGYQSAGGMFSIRWMGDL